MTRAAHWWAGRQAADCRRFTAQVRGKKNVVLDRSLVGPIGTVVKVSTLQEYGVDKFFILENDNADTTQRNVVFIARGESGRHAAAIAGEQPKKKNPPKKTLDFALGLHNGSKGDIVDVTLFGGGQSAG